MTKVNEELLRKAEIVRENIPILRKAVNMTQKELAEMLDLTRQTIVAIEDTNKKFKLYNVIAIAAIFKGLGYEKVERLLEPLGVNALIEELVKNPKEEM